MRQYYVYLMTNKSGTLYTGVTNDPARRVYEHKTGLVRGFTSKYRIDRLVYFEVTTDVRSAIAREKQIKGWLRSRKVALIESANPNWHDLSASWLADGAVEENRPRDPNGEILRRPDKPGLLRMTKGEGTPQYDK